MSRRPHQQAPPQNSQEESMALRVNAIRRYLYRVNSRYQKVAPPRRVMATFIALMACMVFLEPCMVFLLAGLAKGMAVKVLEQPMGVGFKALEAGNAETNVKKYMVMKTW